MNIRCLSPEILREKDMNVNIKYELLTQKQKNVRILKKIDKMNIPEGYEAHIVPRSSTYKNYGLIQTNHMGVVDESYCGDNDQWHMPVFALRDTVIHVNDRICQFRIMEHQPKIVFEEVEALSAPDRGGFGSTGKQ